MNALRVKQVKLVDLKPAPWNPRTISEFQLRALVASLEAYGAVEPIVANADGTILGGHQRWEAAASLGWDAFPVVYVDVDEPTAKRLNVALNQISGEFDESALAAIIGEITSVPIELLDVGLAEEDVKRLLAGLADVPPPAAFPEPGTDADHRCPSCGYEWSGEPR